ncbi:hypothetical protein CONCODRAFT_19828 [Conidiobolus coronatus NRRL 28638]|uniref:Secreted protein n=1 Tax=Conidiobolus coronatus (strain ATCC 28846 / CBS 209.66 / NRRL 28638) TaxID=796925 RepID=A0A137NWT0_CONC2|nr:hypothetical protein CONCODRAFT_19828 [Conidiobolus coronatus NRRL 28638]|eukprot:KXN67131.1 hypothetical protein CONCODRAFT_19828 [Conidiobolus coronatus NRRL 28638]
MLKSIVLFVLPLAQLVTGQGCPGSKKVIQHFSGSGVYKVYCTNDKTGCPEDLPGPSDQCKFVGKEESEKKDYYYYSCTNRDILASWTTDLESKGYKCNRFVVG